MSKKSKKNKKVKVHSFSLGKELFCLLLTRYSEKSKARGEKKYSRKKKHRNRDD